MGFNYGIILQRKPKFTKSSLNVIEYSQNLEQGGISSIVYKHKHGLHLPESHKNLIPTSKIAQIKNKCRIYIPILTNGKCDASEFACTNKTRTG